uniref:NADH dehydrogenase subunit 4L n=1 Tax=Ascidiella aspersa TaxID=201961 RepID=S0DGA4_9ASCI|nr:NADH dehydrogenase subunit 4L [Ascidiella aspersa]CCO25812.1 NADH dehydrogenase subunit 4L [Ascidiella aspersa]
MGLGAVLLGLIMSILVLLLGMSVLYCFPLKYLVMLECLYLLVGVLFAMSTQLGEVWGWLFLFFMVFGACEGVMVLSLNMILGKFVGMMKFTKFYKWS